MPKGAVFDWYRAEHAGCASRARRSREALRRATRARWVRPPGRAGRGVRLPRAERRRQDDGDPDRARAAAPRRRLGPVLGRDPWIDGVAERARIGYLPSGPRFYDRMRGVDLLDHLAALGGGRIAGSRPRARAARAVAAPISPGRSASTPAGCARSSGSSRPSSTSPSCSSSTSRPRASTRSCRRRSTSSCASAGRRARRCSSRRTC